MSNQQQITRLIQSISGQANVLTIPRVFINLADGNIKAALFLSQCVYWSDRGGGKDGWFYKTYAEWEVELGLSRREIISATKQLKAVIEVKVKRANGSPTCHYRVNVDELTEILAMITPDQPEQNVKMESDKSAISESDKSAISLTETTTEITTHNARKENHPRDPVFDSVVEVCKADPKLQGSAIGKVTTKLKAAGYTASDVLAFGKNWWEWKERTKPPTVWKLLDGISQVKSMGGKASPPTGPAKPSGGGPWGNRPSNAK